MPHTVGADLTPDRLLTSRAGLQEKDLSPADPLAEGAARLPRAHGVGIAPGEITRPASTFEEVQVHATTESGGMLSHQNAVRPEVRHLPPVNYPSPRSNQLSTPGGNFIHVENPHHFPQPAATSGNGVGQFSTPGGNFIQPGLQRESLLPEIPGSNSRQFSTSGGNFIQPDAWQCSSLYAVKNRSGSLASRTAGNVSHADIPDIRPPVPFPSDSGSSWHASLQLCFRKQDDKTRLWRTRHEGPLYVQRPFYPEGAELAHVYLLHPPGGLVSGDRLVVSLELDTGARVLCTTPGAGRLYRARPDQRLQEQHNHLQVGSGASLEWFPQETLVFPGAQARIDTRVELAADAQFCGWDISVLGLPANDIRFDHGRLRQRLLILRADLPVLLEALDIDGASSPLLTAAAGLRSQAVSGLFVCGPFDTSQFNAIDTAALVTAATVSAPALRGLTRHGDFLLGRYLGPCAQEARRVFLHWWTALRPALLQRAACPAAIWST